MFVYSGVFVYEIAIMYLYRYLKERKYTKLNTFLKCIVLFFALSIPIIIFGLRDYSVGSDTKSYANIFNWIGSDFSLKNLTVYEFGYSLLNAIIHSITDNFTVLLFVIGGIIVCLTFFAILQLTEDSPVSIAIYMGLGLYAQSFNVMRQYLAISLILVGLVFLIKKNNWWMFLIFIVLATSFHTTAICAIVILPFKYIKFNWIVLSSMGICAIIGIVLFPYLVKLFDAIFKSTYYDSYYTLFTGDLTIKNILYTVVILIALVLALISRNKVKGSGDEQRLKHFDFYLYNLVIFVILEIMSMFTIDLLERVGLYFTFSILFIVPIILNSFDKKNKVILTCVLYIGLLVSMNIVLVKFGAFEVVPYKFI